MSEAEKLALVGNRGAIIQLVSALRRYRESVQKILNKRYTDGECDACALSLFEGEVDEIEADLKEWES